MAYPLGIGPNPYVTSIWTSNLIQECMHKPFLRSPKMKKWVLEFVALLQPEGEVGATLLGQSTPFQILRACTSLVSGVESDTPPTRVGFDSQWALPMSCCFCMFCSSSLGILNQATQYVLSGRVGSLCLPLLP